MPHRIQRRSMARLAGSLAAPLRTARWLLPLAIIAGCNMSTTGDDDHTVSFSIPACPDQGPVIYAVQSGTGSWAAVPQTGDAYNITITSALGGVALIYPGGAIVREGTADELRAIFGQPCFSLQTASGVVSNLSAGTTALIDMGGGSTPVEGPGSPAYSTVTWQAAPDLLAVLQDAQGTPSRVILRRAVNPAAIAPIDFSSSEAIEPAAPSMTVTGSAPNLEISESYISNGAWHDVAEIPSSRSTYVGLPAAIQQPADLFELRVFSNSGSSVAQQVTRRFHDATGQTVAFLAPPPSPTATLVVGGGYPRLRIQWQLTQPYDLVDLDAGTDSGAIYFSVSTAYLRGHVIDLTIPDFSGIPGAAGMIGSLAGSISWRAGVSSGGAGYTDQPADGQTIRYTDFSGTLHL